MSVYQKLINLDKVFRTLEKPPIIINDLQTSTEEEKEDLNNKIYTLHKSGVMDTVAKCECGALSGDYNLGLKCHICNTEVISPIYQDLEPILWVRAPEGVHKLVNPHVWYILNKAFTISNFSLIRWICETTYSPGREFKEISALESLGVKRGYNYFIENFDWIINTLSELKTFAKGPKRDNIELVLRMLRENPDCIFCQYLPLPNKVLMVIEDTNVGRYVDNVYFGIIDAIQMIASIDTIRTHSKKRKEKHTAALTTITDIIGNDESQLINLSDNNLDASPEFLIDNSNIKKKENRIVKMLHALSTFYSNYYKNNLGSKSGLIRKHIFSSRANFSCRAVITSITAPHEYDELYLPWTLAIGVLRYHILNKLTKPGFRANEGVAFINRYARVYHPYLDKILQELIDEAVHVNPQTGRPQVGIPITLCRNPSQGRGSILKLRITHIRKNTEILTFGLSILSVVSLNADFNSTFNTWQGPTQPCYMH